MTKPSDPSPPAPADRDPVVRLEAFRALASRVGLGAITVLLALGMALSLAGDHRGSVWLEAATVCLLAVPLIGIGTLLIETIQKREWPFVRATVLIGLLIVYSVIQKIWGA